MQSMGMDTDDKKSPAAGLRLSIRLLQWADGRDELSELCAVLRKAGADQAERPTLGEPVPGRRGAEQGVADVVATLTGSATVLERVLAALRKWLSGRPQRTVEATIGDASIKITGLSSVNEDRIVEAFVRHLYPEN